MKRKITIIHPSRSRVDLCYKVASLFLNNSNKQNIDYFVSIDESDPFKNLYINKKPNDLFLIIGQTNSCIESINFAAESSNFEDILVVVSDDFICEKNWDYRLRETLNNKIDFVLKTNDGREGWIVTFPIMDKVYYKKFGYVYNPEYNHLFCDTEMTHVADITGKLIFDMSIKFEHLGRSITGDDEVNTKNCNTWGQGEIKYLQRIKENFGLLPQEIVRKVTHEPHLNWLRTKGIVIQD